MTYKPIPLEEWKARADVDFWKPYGRKRSAFEKFRMMRRQFEQLSDKDSNVTHEFAARLGFDENEPANVRALCFHYLAKKTEEEGNIDGAIDYAMRSSEFESDEGQKLLVQLIFSNAKRERAFEAAELLQAVSARPELTIAVSGSRERRELRRAVLLSLLGNDKQARAIANDAFDKLAEIHKDLMYGLLAASSGSNVVDRALFRLVRRGGTVRIVGLIGKESAFSPDSFAAKLGSSVHFGKPSIESLPDRVVVDLDEFSLDVRWTTDSDLLRQVERRYNNFKDNDRKHIPEIPDNPKYALVVLAIGDDVSRPEVINPLIDLDSTLDGFGECIFYDRVGPLSR